MLPAGHQYAAIDIPMPESPLLHLHRPVEAVLSALEPLPKSAQTLKPSSCYMNPGLRSQLLVRLYTLSDRSLMVFNLLRLKSLGSRANGGRSGCISSASTESHAAGPQAMSAIGSQIVQQ